MTDLGFGDWHLLWIQFVATPVSVVYNVSVTYIIFIVIYGRMIEIYLVTSVAPVPMAAMMGKEWGGMRPLLPLAS